MNALTLAHGNYQEVVEENEGKEAKNIAAGLKEREARLRLYVGNVRKQTQEKIEGPAVSVAEQEDAREQAEKDITRITGGGTELRLYRPDGEVDEAAADTLEETADHLGQGAKDFQEATEGHQIVNKAHEGNIGGMATIGVEGSQSFDGAKTQGQTTVVDKDALIGVVEHEHEHTQQDQQDVAGLKIENGTATIVEVDQDSREEDVITATDFTETGSIGAQEKEAPKSVPGLSRHYQERYAKVLSFGIHREEAIKLARQKDGLRKFGEKVTGKKVA
jgi:hypothetical protein